MKLIIIAMKSELSNDIFKKYTKIKRYPFELYKHNDNLLIISGIGLINAASALTWAITKFNVNIVFNIGTAGGISNDIKIAELYNITKAYYNDVDCTMFNYELGQIPQEEPYFELKPFLKNEKNSELLSGNSFINNKNDISIMLEKYNNINIFDMEGASIANICHKFNISCYIIKIVSDIITQNNNQIDHEINLKKCELKLNKFLINL